MHSEIDQIAKYAVDNVNKRVNKVVDRSSKVSLGKQLENTTYLSQTGLEKECIFSSKAPEIQPTINVSYCPTGRPVRKLLLH